MPTAVPEDSGPSSKAILSPTFCYTPFALRTFLRQSRAITDDPVSQQLSAFSQSSTRPFQPFATLPPTRVPSISRLPENICADFISNVLVPAWNDRTRVIKYCSDVANKEDEGDPERAVIEAEQRRKQEMIVNERLDPYSGRFEVRESRRDKLKRAITEELEVESIIRARSWGVLQTRCAAVRGEWSDAAPIPEIGK